MGMIADNNKKECDAGNVFQIAPPIRFPLPARAYPATPTVRTALVTHSINAQAALPTDPSSSMDVAFPPAASLNTSTPPLLPANPAIQAVQAAQAPNSIVLPGLGVCLSELVIVPEPSGTSTAAPLPTITGINTPTPAPTKRSLEWWQILLMALGCAFIFLAVIWCCRRRARKQRAKKTAMFATTPGYGRAKPAGWRWKLIRFGEKLFGHKRSRRADLIIRHHDPHDQESEAIKLRKLRVAEEARGEEDLVKLIGEYNYPDSVDASRARQIQTYEERLASDNRRSVGGASQLSAPSIYSQMTGMPHRTPDPRQPLRKKDLTSRFSSSTFSSSDEERLRMANDRAFKTKNPFWK
ncbi:hypothetical protein DXG01_015990 [Tephrocybe rancida]|nr:hypothetical protein DXG01_015990 [Tephrocybe rancida]